MKALRVMKKKTSEKMMMISTSMAGDSAGESEEGEQDQLYNAGILH